MGLRELKKEVEALPAVTGHIAAFKAAWLQPVRKNTNKQLPFLQELSKETRLELNKKVNTVTDHLHLVNSTNHIHDKLKHYARYLIELKLTTLNGDLAKFNIIKNRLLQDEFMGLQTTITELQYTETALQELTQEYHETTELLQGALTLDESVQFLSLPHKSSLTLLQQTVNKQKQLLHALGQEFLVLARQEVPA
ncbi:hypothetical protein HOI26_05230 [Candidatus Woesearchaeota archaeon]|jgi:hypothetical protein|nr:hypothetical protein [Candidatus Woesearchaeota archaeon]MBT5740469.1 hypothetical protein [Candidatus Woesearchaeota archaeon]